MEGAQVASKDGAILLSPLGSHFWAALPAWEAGPWG